MTESAFQEYAVDEAMYEIPTDNDLEQLGFQKNEEIKSDKNTKYYTYQSDELKGTYYMYDLIILREKLCRIMFHGSVIYDGPIPTIKELITIKTYRMKF